MSDLRTQLLEGCARSLRSFGYPSARADNILTTYVFGKFARDMLSDFMEAKGHADVIQPMLDEIDALKLPERQPA